MNNSRVWENRNRYDGDCAVALGVQWQSIARICRQQSNRRLAQSLAMLISACALLRALRGPRAVLQTID